ncbi:MAG TPA: family 1 glycosylhydrolase, partial [Spirochaetota bacterium]|nr:family 1 glycosylhydrolase [Spirochaetota bacterium]
MGFKKDFVWGAASSSYQIEGAAEADGKSLSVWDVFTRKNNVIQDNSNGDIACDHYNRYKEDVRLMREMKLKAYRFSVSWPRVIDFATGKVNGAGLDFYDRLVDDLLRNGIDPWVTLFHWDYPYELYKRGGWLNPSSPDWFADYTRVVAEKLSDRVSNWFTVNEPNCFVILGHRDGVHAPGDTHGTKQLFEIIHNVLLAHGKSVSVIRSAANRPVKIGYVPPASVCCPLTESPDDIAAAVKGNFTGEIQNVWSSDLWMDPVFFGKYSDDTLERYREFLPPITDADMKIIGQEVDFTGLNIYQGFFVSGDRDGNVIRHGQR